jgi:hypothetical protein
MELKLKIHNQIIKPNEAIRELVQRKTIFESYDAELRNK